MSNRQMAVADISQNWLKINVVREHNELETQTKFEPSSCNTFFLMPM